MAQYPLDEPFQVFCCSLTSFPCKFAVCSKHQAKINYCAAPYSKDVTRERVKPQKTTLLKSDEQVQTFLFILIRVIL